jgi:hypothetical protein
MDIGPTFQPTGKRGDQIHQQLAVQFGLAHRPAIRPRVDYVSLDLLGYGAPVPAGAPYAGTRLGAV